MELVATSPFRVGVGGPVGSGKTALVERLVPLMIARGYHPAVVANDVFTQEDAITLKRTLAGVLEPSRIVGVETGTCPHTAVREDPTGNLAAIDELCAAHPDIDVVFVESGGDNLTLTFSPLLVDRSIYVMDVAGGDKMPRKQGPGMMFADLLVINKVDLAPFVGANVPMMEHDSNALRTGPVMLTDCRVGRGVDSVTDWLERELDARGMPGASRTSAARAAQMGAAEFIWDQDGRPDWGQMWQSFCDLALYGGPPHRGEDTALRHDAVVPPAAPAIASTEWDAIEELRRGILETTGLSTELAPQPGWLAVRCASSRMAAWMAATIILENVDARSEGDVLFVPAWHSFTLEDEVKSVITVVAKTYHYSPQWLANERIA